MTTTGHSSSSVATITAGNHPGASWSQARASMMACAAKFARKPVSSVEPVALTGVYKNMTRAIIALVFRCKVTGGDLAATDEAAAFRWATDADVIRLADEAYAVRVLDAVHADHPAAIRHHDGVNLI